MPPRAPRAGASSADTEWRKLFTTGRGRRFYQPNPDVQDPNASEDLVGTGSISGMVARPDELSRWAWSARTGFDFESVVNRVGEYRNEVIRQNLALSRSKKLGSRFVGMSVGRFQIPKCIRTDRAFAADMNEAYFLEVLH